MDNPGRLRALRVRRGARGDAARRRGGRHTTPLGGGKIAVLATTSEAQALAGALLRAAGLPRKAAIDAVHVGVAAVSAMDLLLTWNCTHIANAVTRPRIEAVCRLSGFEPPTICAPEELPLKEDA